MSRRLHTHRLCQNLFALMVGNMNHFDVDHDVDDENEHEMDTWYHLCQTEGMAYNISPRGDHA